MSTIHDRQQEVKRRAAQEAVYEAALEVIGRPDFKGLRMQNVAIQAGIATGTLYNYFKNKEDLLFYVDRRLHETVLGRIEEISSRPEPASRRLNDIVEAIFEVVGRHRAVFDLAERSGIPDKTPAEEGRALLGSATACFEKVLADGMAEGRFRSVDARRTSRILLHAIIGIFETHKYLKDYDYGPSRRDLLALFEDYLQPARTAPVTLAQEFGIDST